MHFCKSSSRLVGEIDERHGFSCEYHYRWHSVVLHCGFILGEEWKIDDAIRVNAIWNYELTKGGFKIFQAN